MSNLTFKQSARNASQYHVYDGDVLLGSVLQTKRLTTRGEKRCWQAAVTGRCVGVAANRKAAATILLNRTGASK